MAEVVALLKGAEANRRIAFHNLLDEVFDDRLEKDGVEPEALILYMGSLKNEPGGSVVRWTMFGDAYAAATAMVGKAIMGLHQAFDNPDYG
jgi:hypothetical protein